MFIAFNSCVLPCCGPAAAACLRPSLCHWCCQVGWMTGPAVLLGPIIRAHQFVVFTVASNLQHAVAYGLDEADWFYK